MTADPTAESVERAIHILRQVEHRGVADAIIRARDLRNVLTAYGQLVSGAISRPDLPGGFEGDIWFGHPIKRTLGTHKWVKGTWEEIPDETVSMMELLAEARVERDTYRKTMEAMVEAPDVVASLLTRLQAAEQERERLKTESERINQLGKETFRVACEWQHRAEAAEAKLAAPEPRSNNNTKKESI